MTPTLLAVVLAGLAAFAWGMLFFVDLGTNGDRLPALRACRDAMRARWEASPPISRAEVRERGLIVCLGHVLDVTRFRSRHPGGDLFARFAGRDMTPWFLATHAKSTGALRGLQALSIGRCEGASGSTSPLLHPVDAEYVELFERLVDEGRFERDQSAFARDLIEVYAPYAIGVLLVCATGHWILGSICLAFAATRQGFLYHDIMHRSVFPTAQGARSMVRWTSLLLWGFDFNRVGDVHDIHHGFVNVLKTDTAIQIPFLAVHPSQQTPWRVAGFQNAFFYGVLALSMLPFYALAPAIGAILGRSDASALSRYSVAIAAARNLVLIVVSWQLWVALMVATIFAFYVFAAVGSLNHFHMPMYEHDEVFPELEPGSEPSEALSFVKLQSSTVQNSTANAFTNWLFGHFTLHIEHHLFPCMPRRNYSRSVQAVKRLLASEGLRYATAPQWQAVRWFNVTLARRGRVARPPLA